ACNKIGTYLKALAAKDNGVPFYVGLPSPTIDFSLSDGLNEIPIEQRGADEVATVTGRTADGRIERVRIAPEGSAVANYGFHLTPGAPHHRSHHRARRHRTAAGRGCCCLPRPRAARPAAGMT